MVINFEYRLLITETRINYQNLGVKGLIYAPFG